MIPGPRINLYPYDLEVPVTKVIMGYFRVGPFEFLGTDANAAARIMGVQAGQPLQAARGAVALLVQNGVAFGHLIAPSLDQARRIAANWLEGRDGKAESIVGEAVGSFHGRVLYRMIERVRMRKLMSLLEDAQNAAWILKAAEGTPLDREKFDQLVNRLARGLTGIAKPAETKALKDSLNAMARFTDPDVLERAAQAALNKNFNKIPNKIVDPQIILMKKQGKIIQLGTREGINDKFKLGVKSSLSTFDKRIEKHLTDSHVNFVRDKYGEHSEAMSKTARTVINAGQKKGLGISEIQDDLAKKLGIQNVNRNTAYWSTVANAHVNRSRTFTAFGTYREATVTLYQVDATLDEATTDTCRFLHGKILDLDRALENFQQQTELKDPLDLKKVNPWIREISPRGGGPTILAIRPPIGPRGSPVQKPLAIVTRSAVGTKGATGSFSPRMTNRQLQNNGVHGPPYHGECRTDVLPVIRSRRSPR